MGKGASSSRGALDSSGNKRILTPDANEKLKQLFATFYNTGRYRSSDLEFDSAAFHAAFDAFTDYLTSEAFSNIFNQDQLDLTRLPDDQLAALAVEASKVSTQASEKLQVIHDYVRMLTSAQSVPQGLEQRIQAETRNRTRTRNALIAMAMTEAAKRQMSQVTTLAQIIDGSFVLPLSLPLNGLPTFVTSGRFVFPNWKMLPSNRYYPNEDAVEPTTLGELLDLRRQGYRLCSRYGTVDATSIHIVFGVTNTSKTLLLTQVLLPVTLLATHVASSLTATPLPTP